MSKILIQDKVKIKSTGLTGTVIDLPTPTIAWVHLDGTSYNEEYLIPITDLGNVMEQQSSIKKDDNQLEQNRMRGAGGAPTRATTLPEEPTERKNYPIASGVLDYFPDAIVAISKISKAGNDQHNPGLPLRWTRSKSGDESDTCMRHFLQRGTIDTDGMRHTAKAAWRMLAILQKEIESEQDK